MQNFDTFSLHKYRFIVDLELLEYLAPARLGNLAYREYKRRYELRDYKQVS